LILLENLNLTLTRKQSLYEVLQAHKFEKNEQKVLQQQILEDFENRTDKFFRTETGSIPKELIPAHIIVDNIDEAAIVTFDARALAGKGFR